MSYSQSRSSGAYNAGYGDIAGTDLMSGDFAIEADGDFDSEAVDVDDEDLNAAFEAEHGLKFTVIDEVRDENGQKRHTSSREREWEKKKFVIPKLKRTQYEERSYSSSDEGKREWRKNERDIRSRDHDGGRRDRDSRDAGKRDRDGKERDTRQRERDHRRDVRDSKGAGERHSSDVSSQPQNSRSSERSPAVKPSAEKRQSLFESFAEEGLIASPQGPVGSVAANHPLIEREREVRRGGEMTASAPVKDNSMVPGEEDAALEIPMGRDSLVFVRDFHAWQIRMHPVHKADMARTDFAQLWSMVDSSSIVWSSHEDFGGVAEFLIKDQSSIQKFMRKIMWHNFSADLVTVEITERGKSKFSAQDDRGTLDCIINQMVFKYHNSRARQLIKTYYPTPQGEVTERSVYVNNINSGNAVNLLKAIFPCAAKISVARSTNETSTALVETAGVEETCNYLAVYDQISVNSREVTLSSVHVDWENAKKQYEDKQARNKTKADSSKPAAPKTAEPAAGKRPADTPASSRPAKRGKGPTTPAGGEASARDRGPAPRGGASSRGRAGRGGAPAPPPNRNKGRALLPHPPMATGDGLLPLPVPPDPMMGGGEGLLPRPDQGLPPPLMAVPVNPTPKGIEEADLLGPPETDYRTVELKEIRQELESRVLETRAQLESQLSKLDQAYRVGMPAKPRRPVDYREEDGGREAPRRALLPVEGHMRPGLDDWMEEPPAYRRPAPPAPARPGPPPPAPAPRDRGYDAGGAYGRSRREEDYGDVRPSRPRPYLLEAPPEQDDLVEERQVFDYDHAHRLARVEPEARRDDSRPLLSRPSALDRDRSLLGGREYPEELSYSSRSRYDYEEAPSRRAPAYGGYDEESRRLAARYKEDYDRRY